MVNVVGPDSALMLMVLYVPVVEDRPVDGSHFHSLQLQHLSLANFISTGKTATPGNKQELNVSYVGAGAGPDGGLGTPFTISNGSGNALSIALVSENIHANEIIALSPALMVPILYIKPNAMS
jgi:hypothetical protein